MANPTTAFGWVMPNSADLVTDLPADFAVFGQGVDTSMQYLLGGTTGQVLSKTSGTNMAFTWIANDQGDLTAITAGTGISVTSPTGPIPTVAIDATVATLTGSQTLTNKTLTSPALTTPTISTATTNGDILYGTGSGALARLGIGSSAQVLTVASGIPSWATPAAAASGLTLITRQTFTGVATTTTTFDGCFTSTYKAYQIVMESIDAATNNTFLYLQWRYAGPTTQSASYYGAAWNFDHTGTTTGTTQAGVSQISILKASASTGSGLGTMVNLNVTGVGNSSQRPLVTSIGTSVSTTGPTIMGVINDTARTYTGFILSAASGNISGTVAVYGLATA